MAQVGLDEFDTDSTDTQTGADAGDDSGEGEWSEGDRILFRNVLTTVIEPIDDDRVAIESPTVQGGRTVADREHLSEPHTGR